MNKKGQGFWGVVGIVAVIAVIVVLVMSLLGGGLGGLFAVSQDDDKAVLTTSETTPTLTFACVDAFEKGTTVTCAAYRYKVNDGNIQTSSDNTIEVDCGDKIEALINGSSYYREKVIVDSVPCSENPSVSVELVNYDTAPDMQLYNQDDGTLNSASSTEGLPANCQDVQTVKIYPAYHDGIKDAYFVMDLKGTNIDKVTSNLGANIGKPASMVHNATAGIAGGANPDEMYVFPLGTIGDQAIEEFTVTVDCGGTAYGTANGSICIIDQDYFVGFDGDFEKGFQDDDNTDVGQDHQVHCEPFFTASS